MSDNYYSEYGGKKKPERGSRPLLVIGIILLCLSFFLAAFVFSFNLIMNPVEERDELVQTLTDENTKLKNDTRLLQDQLDVVKAELDTYKKRSSSAAPSRSSSENSSSSGSGSRSSSRDDSDLDDD